MINLQLTPIDFIRKNNNIAAFNPKLVQLQEFMYFLKGIMATIFQSQTGSITRGCIISVIALSFVFQSQTGSITSIISLYGVPFTVEFQSQTGSITRVLIQRILLMQRVSIPNWFNYKNNTARLTRNCYNVSIPNWFNYKDPFPVLL